jgi:4-amino-4-deoxy-L-arabinose transferase-like glycosyltransferase
VASLSLSHSLRGRATGAASRWFRPVPVLGAVLVLYVGASILLSLGGGSSGDESAYFGFAERLTHGGYADAAQADRYLWRGPGLPLLLTPFAALDAPIDLPRLITPLALFGAVLVFHRLLRRRFTARFALAGALALAAYYPFARSLGFVSTEPVAVLLVVLALDGWVRRAAGAGRGSLVGTGAALGALALTRPEYGYVLTACLLLAGLSLLARRTRAARDGLAVCAVGLALCVPWLAYTYSLTDKVFYWSNAGGLSLYWMSGPTAADLGDPNDERQVFTDPNLAEQRPFFRRLRTLSPVAYDAELRRVARAQISAHPGRYARNVVDNLSRMLFNFPFSYKQQSASAVFYVIANGLLLVGVALGAIVLARTRRWWGLALGPVTFALLGFAAHVPVGSYPRYWFPVVPVAVWLAVLGVGRLIGADTRAPAS